MDTLTPEQRSLNMSHIHGRDTGPEVLVRKYLFAKGLRYRKNDKRFPGHPDIVFPKFKTVIFVHGCFWHGHEGCRYFRIPSTNVEFWEAKIRRNRERDTKDAAELEKLGWKVITVWECRIRRKADRAEALEEVYRKLIGEQ